MMLSVIRHLSRLSVKLNLDHLTKTLGNVVSMISRAVLGGFKFQWN